MKNYLITFNKVDFEKPPLRHLEAMTTEIGLIQHGLGSEPDMRFGYSIDDNARALIVCLELNRRNSSKKNEKLISIYYKFLEKSLTKKGFFHNFMDKDGAFLDESGSQDSFGRTIWALCAAIAQEENLELRIRAKQTFDLASRNFGKISALRANAFLLLGFSLIKEKNLIKKVSRKILKKYEKNTSQEWRWFEDKLTYSNAIMPYALLMSYIVTQKEEVLEVGLESLDFLLESSQIDGVPAPIGQNGWYRRGEEKAQFDQQLIDVADMVLASATAYKSTHNMRYLNEAKRWFAWFLGENVLSLSLLDPRSEGCFDALKPDGVNPNQGAESILAYLLAFNEMRDLAIEESK